MFVTSLACILPFFGWQNTGLLACSIGTRFLPALCEYPHAAMLRFPFFAALIGGANAFAMQPPKPCGLCRTTLQPSTCAACRDAKMISVSTAAAGVAAAVGVGIPLGMMMGEGMVEMKSQTSLSDNKAESRMQMMQIAGAKKVHAPVPRRSRRGLPPVMIEANVVAGIGLLVVGTAGGVGLIATIEKQGFKSNERGGMSDETRTRLAAKYMEDEELVTGLDDTIAKMEAAMAAVEGREVIEGDGLTEAEKEELKEAGWGD